MTPARELSLVHLVRPPRVESSSPPLAILLHGVGSNEADLFGLAPELDGRLLVLSVRAPIQLGANAYGWYHIQFTPNGLIADEKEAEQSRQFLARFVDEAIDAYDADRRSVFLLGFSQGAIMSVALALTHPEKVAGVVAMSGRSPINALPFVAPDEALHGLPILAVHGSEDQVLPITYGRELRAALEQLPVDLTYREYPMGHWVTPESLLDVTTWLSARLEAPRGG